MHMKRYVKFQQYQELDKVLIKLTTTDINCTRKMLNGLKFQNGKQGN